jgi:hypothetical protein
MDASEFFQIVAEPNYEQLIGDPSDLRSLWNAVVSMNTIAEFLLSIGLNISRLLAPLLITLRRTYGNNFQVFWTLNFVLKRSNTYGRYPALAQEKSQHLRRLLAFHPGIRRHGRLTSLML